MGVPWTEHCPVLSAARHPGGAGVWWFWSCAKRREVSDWRPTWTQHCGRPWS